MQGQYAPRNASSKKASPTRSTLPKVIGLDLLARQIGWTS